MLAFRENGNVGWEATQDGEALTPVRVDGWQQGWLLDPDAAGPGGRDLRARSGSTAWGLLARCCSRHSSLLALVLFWLAPAAERRPAAGRHRRAPAVAVDRCAAVAIGLVAGWSGLLVLAATYAVGIPLGRRVPETARRSLFAGCVVAASFFYAFHPWGDGWAGVERLASALVRGGRWPVWSSASAEPTWRRRIAGSSTKR